MCHPVFYHMHCEVQRNNIKTNIPVFSFVLAFERGKEKAFKYSRAVGTSFYILRPGMFEEQNNHASENHFSPVSYAQ